MPVEALEALLALASAVLAVFGGGMAVRRRRRQQLAAAVAVAHGHRAAASAQLAAASAAFTALRGEVKADAVAAAAAERDRLVDELAPLERQLHTLLRGAPAGHVLTPGLQLVARQLSGVLDPWRRDDQRAGTDKG